MRQVGPFIMVGVALGPLIRFRFWPQFVKEVKVFKMAPIL